MPASRPLFLARRIYRLRRLMDAARLLPLLGLFLFLLPVLWMPEAGQARSTAADGIYLFLVWPLLIVLAFLLSRALAPVTEEGETPPDAGFSADLVADPGSDPRAGVGSPAEPEARRQ